jgi:hypothetical protein
VVLRYQKPECKHFRDIPQGFSQEKRMFFIDARCLWIIFFDFVMRQ